MAELIYLPVAEIHPHPDNPRKDLGDLTELADGIRANGVLQNLTVVRGCRLTDSDVEQIKEVCDKEGVDIEKFREELDNRWSKEGYTVIIGHRRLAAAKLAGLEKVPCVIVELSPMEQARTMLIENIQRSELTAYEQAQGFQMMLDMGDTVESIAKGTGFSATTVRRRIKMAELDPDKLKEVSDRQISLRDFDALAQIEDIDERNKVLESIGTRNFDIEIRGALYRQLIKANMPAVKKWLEDIKAKKIAPSDTWSGKYDSCSDYIRIAKWGEEGNVPPDEIPDPVFYYMDDNGVRLYKKHTKAKPEKKPKAVLEREAAIDGAWKALDDTAAMALELRRQFVEKLAVTGKNRADILFGALYAGLLSAVDYNGTDRDGVCKVLGLSDLNYQNRGEKLEAAVGGIKDKDIPLLVYGLFGDCAASCVDSVYRRDFPIYKRSVKLTLLYKWLTGLGYLLSTVEEQLLNGDHEGYCAGERYDERITGEAQGDGPEE